MTSAFEQAIESLATQFEGDIYLDPLMRTIYATDASAYQETPCAVAIPRSDADIKRLILLAREQGVGIIPRTAGTSLAGQVVGAGIVVDVSKNFGQILEINESERWVRVQPGVIRNELNQRLSQHGMLFGPETSTANRAMIGGMVGNNSCGSNSVIYGSTRDHLLEVKGFLSDGSFVVFNSLSAEAFEEKCSGDPASLETQIYLGTREMLVNPEVRKDITSEFPDPTIPRRNTGYALDLLMDASCFDRASSQPFNFCKLIAGSEGTLFFATELKLNCLPLPPPVTGLLCAHFETVQEALLATQISVGFDPYAVELIDHFILEGASRNREQSGNAAFVEGEPGAILVTEIRGETEQEVIAITSKIEHELRSRGWGFAFPVLSGNDINKVWELRKAGLGIVGNVPGDSKPCAVIEDTAVRVADLPDYIAEFNDLLQSKYGLECVHYAHAGSGEIHLRPILNLKTKAGQEQFRDIARDIADLVKKYRGSLSGEHGDGRLRGEFLERMIGSANYQRVKTVKHIWDPDNVFNPQKIIGTPPMNENLRYQPDQETPDLPTIFDFSEEQGILRAAEFCSGSGDCRKTHLAGGTMCPSYMATRNEVDTTRARANMLRHVLTTPTDAEFPFNSEDLRQTMDLCLSCKGCKRECPSNVDVGKMKAEFLQGYYDANGIPARARRIANFSSQMKWASKVPWLFNWLTRSRLTGPLVKRFAGFSTRRSLPELPRQTLGSWFARHRPHSAAGSRGKVFLFCDEFTNYTDTSIGIAAVELLERIGLEVVLLEHSESGRAAISKGLLRQARTHAEQNVDVFANQVSPESPLIGIEPSAILSFRDEYPQLVRSKYRQAAQQIAENTLMVDELIAKLIDDGSLHARQFESKEQVIRLHGHCHQKALASLKPTIQMLQLPKGHRVRIIPSGCCGMAGSFGYEAEHFELSMQIGELVLFPTIRKEPEDSVICAPGTSCRHQILDGTGRQAFHPIEILRRQWQEE